MREEEEVVLTLEIGFQAMHQMKKKKKIIEIKANGKNEVYMYLKVFGISLEIKK